MARADGSWQKSGLSVRAYCKEQGVVETSFYAWRRELTVRTRGSNSSGHSSQEENAPSTVKDSRGRTIPMRFRDSDQQALLIDGSGSNPFIILSVVQQPPVERTVAAARAGLRVATPSGYRIFVATADDLLLLEKILPILENR